jgi:16S rRNA (cytidine1402-2'-O)-methyltransferase
MANKGKLFLIPNVISESTQEKVIPAMIKEALPAISHFLAEDIRTARRFLSSLKIYPSIEALNIEVLNKDTSASQLSALMAPLNAGSHVGVISESGCPGVADPGALAVEYAHQQNIQVVPLVGPSSILLALMASGLNGQKFAFHGYLPIEAKEAGQALKELEKESKQKSQTQIFIETPYRNNSVFDYFLKYLHSETRLTVALDLTGQQEFIRTRRIADWTKEKPVWAKSPAVFLFLA